MNESVALVVPSLTGDVDDLMASVERQRVQPAEVAVVVGVSPNGRARNVGAARTRAPVLLFADDDAVLGPDDTLARVVAPLCDPTIGAVGTAKLTPPTSSWFQRRVAAEVPRIEHPVVRELTDSSPPVGRHGYTDVTTTFCAMRREVFEEVGGFDDELVRGVDSQFLYRVRVAGYRLVVAPDVWVHHPAPATLGALLAKHFRYGIGYAQTVRRHPELAAGRYLSTPAHAVAYAVLRTVLVVPHTFLPYSHADAVRRPGFKPLRALSSYAAGVGYVYGWYRYP